MKKSSCVLRGLALLLATITLNLHAQPTGFAVTDRGADYDLIGTAVGGTVPGSMESDPTPKSGK
jgi:hypothetical protein